MIIAECFRIDYPQWSFGEDQSRAFLSENEPLGLFFGPTDSKLSGLRIQISNDAEQLEVYLDNRVSLLRLEPDYFGEATSPAVDSPLHYLLGQPLRRIFLGECPRAAGGLLTTAIRLEVERDTLTFFNAADEGRYFLGEEAELWQHYTEVYPVEWRNYSQWLRLLGTEATGLPYQLV
ncbi:hypothetical protein [Hymenobacter jeollabukensis]|uniref:Uncharacterized protein n=1 Tax=Hymenobacter jeollabukensis TaxID=2025313 RepID=A0A5R8WKR7_9BACT|nr:hypothetical protein [Hymenobacter jeollabukensis]TLM89490.1 hypothetical protein FDY95_20675 [Hymenobacter jeollabukensis]